MTIRDQAIVWVRSGVDFVVGPEAFSVTLSGVVSGASPWPHWFLRGFWGERIRGALARFRGAADG